MDTLPFIMRRLEAARFHRLFATGSRSFDSKWLLKPEQVIFLGVGRALSGGQHSLSPKWPVKLGGNCLSS